MGIYLDTRHISVLSGLVLVSRYHNFEPVQISNQFQFRCSINFLDRIQFGFFSILKPDRPGCCTKSDHEPVTQPGGV